MVSGCFTERNLFVLSVGCVYCVCLPIFYVRVCFMKVGEGFWTPGLRNRWAPGLQTKIIRAPKKLTKGSRVRYAFLL